MQLSIAVEQLLKHIQDEHFKIKYDANFVQSDEQVVMIGLGDSLSAASRISLNQKKTKYRSVSELVYHVDERLAAEWRETMGDSPESWTYILEDLSPDTCFSLILFYFRLCGVDPHTVPTSWIDYVNRWEEGDVKTTGEPYVSWGCLHNSLAHSYFGGTRPQESIIQAGFKACLTFVLTMLAQNVNPSAVPEIHLEEYYRAYGFLNREYQEYLQALHHANLVQLRVPIRDSRHTLLVDAFISKEKTALGAAKAFLRNDSEHTFFKSGFSLMAVHRPDAVGTGNDIVISTDPITGIYLKDLWMELERLEDEKWQGERPVDQPRFSEVSDANQPWFHEMGRYTMVAAPKEIGGVPGSKLSWKEVMDVLWKLYHPASSIRVRPYEKDGTSLGEACPVHSCTPDIQDEKSGKQLLAMKWDEEDDQALLLTPTLKQYFAACILKKESAHLPTLDSLPPQNSYDFMELTGGLAIIHSEGVLLLDDWSKEEIFIESFRAEFCNLLKRYNEIAEVKLEISNEMDAIRSTLEIKKILSGRQLLRLSNRLSRIKLKLRQTILQTMPSHSDYFLMQFRQKVETRWAIDSQLEELYVAVAELESIMKNNSETRTSYLINAITIYGFPWALTTGIFGIIFADGMHWMGWICFIGSSLFLSLLIKYLDNRNIKQNFK
ncbi:hypothetical protein [Paenibacillus sp. sgz302251]|uniref:hypothetical protein n=1 Tax=Paenibacillus sp. sgz302251 TaxID=3414493 RepID=UPI003C798586